MKEAADALLSQCLGLCTLKVEDSDVNNGNYE